MRTEWILTAILTFAGVYALTLYNRLARLRNLVREGWSGIDVQLRRRTDLIPNLIDTVKGYAAHERALFEQVTRARARSIDAHNVPSQEAAERALRGSLTRLMALAEAYPELKADKNFLDLQRQLAEIEDQLQMARRYYNGAVRDLNIAVNAFPNSLLSRLFGFCEEPYFELNERAEAAAPKVVMGT
ncbi:MAG TPA: LemA family protein [Xanthobacteraceae bacterium]|nr:LemA family protein [Xanthobacteraceae bacterium]